MIPINLYFNVYTQHIDTLIECETKSIKISQSFRFSNLPLNHTIGDSSKYQIAEITPLRVLIEGELTNPSRNNF